MKHRNRRNFLLPVRPSKCKTMDGQDRTQCHRWHKWEKIAFVTFPGFLLHISYRRYASRPAQSSPCSVSAMIPWCQQENLKTSSLNDVMSSPRVLPDTVFTVIKGENYERVNDKARECFPAARVRGTSLGQRAARWRLLSFSDQPERAARRDGLCASRTRCPLRAWLHTLVAVNMKAEDRKT